MENMNDNISTRDWAVSRAEKWKAQISGMEAMLSPVDTELIRALQLDRRLRIAEVGCGGGGTTLELARHAPAGSVVHGYDIADTLIELARERAHGQPGLAFAIADMASAPPPAERYDRLTSRFGVMFFDDPGMAFANLRHWLEPKGKFAFAVWGPLSENPWITVVREAVAGVIALPVPNLNGPGPFRYADASQFCAVLGGAGFGGLEIRTWQYRQKIGGGLPPAEAARFAIAAFASFGELLQQAGGNALDKARQTLTERFATEHLHAGVVELDASIHIVTGTSDS
jgi:SAM-dependent methyltransferase